MACAKLKSPGGRNISLDQLQNTGVRPQAYAFMRYSLDLPLLRHASSRASRICAEIVLTTYNTPGSWRSLPKVANAPGEEVGSSQSSLYSPFYLPTIMAFAVPPPASFSVLLSPSCCQAGLPTRGFAALPGLLEDSKSVLLLYRLHIAWKQISSSRRIILDEARWFVFARSCLPLFFLSSEVQKA